MMFLLAIQVLYVGESQGGHVASKAAVVYPPDALILLSSVPDVIEVPLLKELQVATIIGWKV